MYIRPVFKSSILEVGPRPLFRGRCRGCIVRAVILGHSAPDFGLLRCELMRTDRVASPRATQSSPAFNHAPAQTTPARAGACLIFAAPCRPPLGA